MSGWTSLVSITDCNTVPMCALCEQFGRHSRGTCMLPARRIRDQQCMSHMPIPHVYMWPIGRSVLDKGCCMHCLIGRDNGACICWSIFPYGFPIMHGKSAGNSAHQDMNAECPVKCLRIACWGADDTVHVEAPFIGTIACNSACEALSWIDTKCYRQPRCALPPKHTFHYAIILCMGWCRHVLASAPVNTCMCVHLWACACACMHASMCLCVHVCVCVRARWVLSWVSSE